MNDDMDQFEQRLRRQPMKPLPSGWRAEILAAAKPATLSAKVSFLTALNLRLRAVLWPHPVAWAGLAAVWLMIGLLNFAGNEKPAQSLARAPMPSPDVLAAWPTQSKLYAEVLGNAVPPEADRPPMIPSKPRSNRTAFERA